MDNDVLTTLNEVKEQQKEIDRKKALAEARRDTLQEKEAELKERLSQLGADSAEQARQMADELEKSAAQRLVVINKRLKEAQ